MTIQPVTRGKSQGPLRRPGTGGRVRACALAIMTAAVAALMCGCGAAQAPAGVTPESGSAVTPAVTLPPGVMPATQACRLVTGREPRGFFTHIEQVHLVLTTYAKGEPIESQGDISTGMAPRTLVWVVEVHARTIHWDHSAPALAPGSLSAVNDRARTTRPDRPAPRASPPACKA
jgi:hypothetical protein